MDVALSNAPQGAILTDRVMVFNTNIAAQTGARLLAESSNSLSKSLARLSSGSRLVSASDDVAGSAASMRLDAQINRTAAAASNVRNSISFAQTQDGYLKKVAKALDRMSELAVLAQDVTKVDADRALYNTEYGKLGTYVFDLATKQFNDVDLFWANSLSVTTDSDGGTFLAVHASRFRAPATAANVLGVGTAATALASVALIKTATTELAVDRSVVGSTLSVLSSYSEQLAGLNDNLTAANSRIKDVDMAEESTQFARFNILVQAGTAMLAQANSGPKSVLRLIQ